MHDPASTSTAGTGARSAAPGPAVWAYDKFALTLPEWRRYPRERLRLVREALLAQTARSPHWVAACEPLDWGTQELVHTPAYPTGLRTGAFPRAQELELGLPFSAQLVPRAWATAFGTVQAALAALREGAAAMLGGVNHHGFADRPAGNCLFDDLAIAIRGLQRARAAERFGVVDPDGHRGNGTAEIFSHDAKVLTFSRHAAPNWPHAKSQSDLDIALPDCTGDEAYLAALQTPPKAILERFHPNVVFDQPGVDPLYSDRPGRLAFTHAGLRARDERVLRACRDLALPVIVTLGGEYAQPIEDSVLAHVNTLCVLRETWAAPAP